MVISFCFSYLGPLRGAFCLSYVDALVTDFYLKPFMTLADVSDLERVLFEPFLSNFLPPPPPPCSSQELIPGRLEITSMLFRAGNDVLTDGQR